MMKVHIVNEDDGHVIPRMMRWLVNKYSWSMSNRIDHRADLNYYAPYTAVALGQTGTTTAAWFTHKEDDHRGKLSLWHRAKRLIDYPLVTSHVIKDLNNFYVITPGIDLKHFKPGKKPSTKKAVVGVAGIGQPRKGYDLFNSLIECEETLNIEVKVAGRYWDRGRWYSYEEMPDFYRSLDVFVCTSINEGIPIPPLEALACGIKTVVPRSVGMMDELAGSPGVYFYDKGNFESMCEAVLIALDDSITKKVMHESMDIYSIDAWCESHYNTFEWILTQ